MPLFFSRAVTRRLWPAGVAAALLLAPALPGAAQSLLTAAAAAPYWQQEVRYRITVSLDDQRHELRATEELTYVNHSPDALPFIWFHLWPNAYRDTHTAYARQQIRNGARRFQFDADSTRGLIDGLAFTVDGTPAALEYDPHTPDVAKLILPRPLAPGATAVIQTPFRVKLPVNHSRSGHAGQSYQVAQWYPKPAVYDRAGWHPMPYLDQGEFYSEFGSFDVSITLPANYTVAATGELQNPEERARLDSLAADGARRAETGLKGFERPGTTSMMRAPRMRPQMPPSSPRLKTLRYTQDRVHDFAWFADKRYFVLKSGVTLPRSGRTVTTWLYFTSDQAADWLKHRADIDATVLGYSRLVGDYPYASASAVSGPQAPGSGGMEYPMVTITDASAIVHEVGHNWFYGILGTNERDYPWLDEGINSYTEQRVSAPLDSVREAAASAKKAKTGSPPAASPPTSGIPPLLTRFFGFDGLPAASLSDLTWQIGTSRGYSQPVGSRSVDFTDVNYGADVYARTPALLRYLAAYLGQARFDSCMHAYYRTWQFRHPQPADLAAVFNRTSGRNLDWFFRDQITTTLRPDAALTRLRVGSDSVRVRVLNQGDSLLTVPVATVDAQGQVLDQVWTPLFRDQGVVSLPRNPAARAVVIDPNYVVPTLHRADDRLRLAGPLRTWNPVSIRPLFAPERWDRNTLTWAPVVGANTTDKLMAGVYLTSSSVVQRAARFQALPMYSFNRKQLNGFGNFSYTILGEGRLAETTTSLGIARFERFLKIEPRLTIRFRPLEPLGIRQTLQIAVTTLRRDELAGDDASGTFGAARWGAYEAETGNALQRLSARAEFHNYYASALTPRLGPTIRFDGANVARLTVRYQRYYSAKKAITARLFGGRIFGRSQDFFYLGLSGSPDYLRETTFLDRATISRALEAGPRQTDDRDGAFHAWLPVLANRWLTTASVEANLPFVPLTAYGDVGTAAGSTLARRTYYGAGLVLRPLRGSELVRIYLPLAGSNYAQDTPGSWGEFTSAIRFSLQLNLFSPEKLIRGTLEK